MHYEGPEISWFSLLSDQIWYPRTEPKVWGSGLSSERSCLYFRSEHQIWCKRYRIVPSSSFLLMNQIWSILSYLTLSLLFIINHGFYLIFMDDEPWYSQILSDLYQLTPLSKWSGETSLGRIDDGLSFLLTSVLSIGQFPAFQVFQIYPLI